MSAVATADGEVPASGGQRSLRPLAGVLAASTVSVTGTRVSAIALPWFVLSTTGSATRTGLAAFCELTPYVLVKALTGPIVDRIGPRLMSWTTDSASALAVGLIPLLHSVRALSFPLLLVLVAVIGALRGPSDLAKGVMIPEAAELGRIPLERATGIEGAAERLASTIGPAVGGALVAALGPMPGLVVDAASFAVGSMIIGLTLPRGMGRSAARQDGGPEAADGGGEPGYLRRFAEGWRFLRGERLLLAISVMVGITNLLDAGFMTVLLPVWAKDSGRGPGVIGLTLTLWGVTAVCGSVAAATAAHRLPRRVVFFVGFLVAGAPRFLITSFGVPLWAVLAVFTAGGLGSGFLNPIIGAVIFERIPRRLLGRVGALIDSTAWAGIPLGGLIAGGAVAVVGLGPVLLVAGTAYFLTTTLTGLRPEWREMDRLRGKGRAPDLPADQAPEFESHESQGSADRVGWELRGEG
jgi:MFS family permease